MAWMINQPLELCIVSPDLCSGGSVTGGPSPRRVFFLVSRTAFFYHGEEELSLFAQDHGALETRWQVTAL